MEKIGLLLKTNGEMIEYKIDMSEHTNNIGCLLNDKITFLGQLLREPEKTNAIIMYGKNAYKKGLEKNKAELLEPFENDIYGDIFIISMDENSEPDDFILNDYKEYKENYECLYKKKYYM